MRHISLFKDICSGINVNRPQLRGRFTYFWTGSISRVLSRTVIYLGCTLLHTSSGAPREMATLARLSHGVRPCTGVRILPFHFDVAVDLFHKGISILSELSVSARTSHLATDGRYPLPFPLFLQTNRCARTFLPVSASGRTRGNCLNQSFYIIPQN